MLSDYSFCCTTTAATASHCIHPAQFWPQPAASITSKPAQRLRSKRIRSSSGGTAKVTRIRNKDAITQNNNFDLLYKSSYIVITKAKLPDDLSSRDLFGPKYCETGVRTSCTRSVGLRCAGSCVRKTPGVYITAHYTDHTLGQYALACASYVLWPR